MGTFSKPGSGGAGGGDTTGPSSSTNNHITAFSGTSGKVIKETEDVVLKALSTTSDPTIEILDSIGTPEFVISADFLSGDNGILSASPLYLDVLGTNSLFMRAGNGTVDLEFNDNITLLSKLSTSTPAINFKNSSNATILNLEYDENSNTITFEETGSGTGFVIKGSDPIIEATHASGSIQLIHKTSDDTQGVILIQNQGTNAGITNFFVGDRNPESFVPATNGDLYYRTDSSAAIYLKTGGTSTFGWKELLHTGTSGIGNVVGPNSSSNNSLCVFNGTSGKLIKENSNIVTSGSILNIKELSPIGVGKLEFSDGASTVVGILAADNGNDVIELESPSTYDIDIKANSNTARISTSGTGHIDLVNSTGLDTNYLASFKKTGTNAGTSNLYVGNRNPESNVTANGGDIYVRDDTTNSAIYLKTSDSSNTNWGELLHTANMSPVFSQISRNIATGVLVQALTPAGVQCNAFTGPDFTTTGKLEANVASNRIDIKDVENTTLGDLYRINCTIVFSATTGEQPLFSIKYNNGATTTGTNLVCQENTLGSSNILTTNMSGLFRGPTSLTGTGWISLFAQEPSTTSIDWRAIVLTAERVKLA